MNNFKAPLVLLAFAASLTVLVSCAETTPVEEARSTYFAAVEGSDEDCQSWLDWCIDEGYPQAACEERSEYCEAGRWVGGDREEDESSDPCMEVAQLAERNCLDAGGTAEDCREEAAAAYDDCAAE